MSISQPVILIIGILSILSIGLIDYIVIIDIAFSICYLIPIFIVTRNIDRRSGILLSSLSAIVWGIAEHKAKVSLAKFILLWNTGVRLTVFLTIVNLLSSLKESYEREQKLARIDGLTKIYNRRYFFELFKKECKRSIPYRHCLTLVYFDVDNFKAVNDRLGHDSGDKLLSSIARTVSENIREIDIFARLGGDEFTLLLPETNYEQAQLVLRRLHQQLIQATTEKSFQVGFSIGAVTFLEFPESVETMLQQVDFLMYQVKNSGKNKIEHQLHQGER
jgi:diguanylate cyclase (GGDEF)-like protein